MGVGETSWRVPQSLLEPRDDGSGFKRDGGRLMQKQADWVRPIKTHADNECFVKLLENHVEEISMFLRHPIADATNWPGEQAIRPPVVN
jgi:transposase